MPMYNIPEPETIRREIEASHERCKQYGINPEETCNPRQKRLTSEELAERLEVNREFLEIASTQMEELYQFVAGAGFAVNIADRDGYILHDLGDKPIVDELTLGNCCPGYRWTEKDVGTSVISLALAREIPVQINDDEHFCRRGYGHTCSASPVFDPDNQLIGVIAMSGNADQVHPHTLGMVITAAHAIENQLRIQKTSQELRLHNNYMSAILDSIDSGVMAIDEKGMINKINNQGRRILEWRDNLEGKPLAEIIGGQIDIDAMTALISKIRLKISTRSTRWANKHCQKPSGKVPFTATRHFRHLPALIRATSMRICRLVWRPGHPSPVCGMCPRPT